MMQPEFVKLDSFNIVGILYFGKNENDEISGMWQRHAHKVQSLPQAQQQGQTYGFCFQNEDYLEHGLFYYMIAVEVADLHSNIIPMQMAGKTVPAHEYAVFRHQGGPSRLGETYQFIEGEWLPKQKFKRNDAFDFELYREIDGAQHLDIYLPILRD